MVSILSELNLPLTAQGDSAGRRTLRPMRCWRATERPLVYSSTGGPWGTTHQATRYVTNKGTMPVAIPRKTAASLTIFGSISNISPSAPNKPASCLSVVDRYSFFKSARPIRGHRHYQNRRTGRIRRRQSARFDRQRVRTAVAARRDSCQPCMALILPHAQSSLTVRGDSAGRRTLRLRALLG